MKHLSLILVILAIAVALSADGAFRYYGEVSEALSTHITSKASQRYVLDEAVAVFGGLISVDGKMSMSYDLEPEKNYHFFAFGDHDTQDLDISVYDSTENRIHTDASGSAYGSLDFTVPSRGKYRLEIYNYGDDWDFEGEYMPVYAIGGLMVQKQYGDSSVALFLEALRNLISRSSDIEDGQSLGTYSDVVSFGGGIVQSGETSTVFNLNYSETTDVVIAVVGSNNVEDADLKVTRQSAVGEVNFDWYSDDAGEVVSETNIDPMAKASCTFDSSKHYAIKYRNYESDGDGFLLYLVGTR